MDSYRGDGQERREYDGAEVAEMVTALLETVPHVTREEAGNVYRRAYDDVASFLDEGTPSVVIARAAFQRTERLLRQRVRGQ